MPYNRSGRVLHFERSLPERATGCSKCNSADRELDQYLVLTYENGYLRGFFGDYLIYEGMPTSPSDYEIYYQGYQDGRSDFNE